MQIRTNIPALIYYLAPIFYHKKATNPQTTINESHLQPKQKLPQKQSHQLP